MNPFILKGKCSKKLLLKIKSIQNSKTSKLNRLLLIPLKDILNDTQKYDNREFTNSPQTVSQVTADFDKSSSFAPLMSNLIFFVKGIKPKIQESEMTNKIIPKFNLLKGFKDHKIRDSLKTPIIKNLNLSCSWELTNKQRVYRNI